ncbi:glycosyltransferase family 4 protein [Shinella zoogloeoides]|uniref:Glycosyltransferase n=1 Tax=Shinella zoogloeoides TaxID=352475 RepID=A0A6N8TKE0_SHIZO|nr:glycosyltransferase family 4 protein [Shinella zoogloeoides]MXO02726.1 glycosyltransferase [Shinella zoogloeoides]UEX81824.1 glycosyltransferase family 4 protein [Shinella zoogloeoides]
MKIIILAQYFELADQPGITLLSAMAQSLAGDGHDVHVISGRHVRIGRKPAGSDQKVPAGYTIHRVWSGNDVARSLFSRALSFLAFSLSSTLALLRLGRCDVIYGSSPPIFPMFPALLWARIRGIRFVLEVCDLWPESAVALGLLRNQFLIAVTAAVERFLYRYSDGIVVLTQGIARRLGERRELRAPVLVARCAVSLADFQEAAAHRQDIRRQYGWDGKCVVIFAGTLGHAQDIETLLFAAEKLEQHETVHFVIIGDGACHALVAAQAATRKNIELLAPKPKTETLKMLAAADIGLCTLKDVALFNSALPTKLIDYIAAGLGIVAPDFEEITPLMNGSKTQALYRPGDGRSLADAVSTLAEEWPDESGASRSNDFPEEFTLEHRNGAIARFVGELHDASSKYDME